MCVPADPKLTFPNSQKIRTFFKHPIRRFAYISTGTRIEDETPSENESKTEDTDEDSDKSETEATSMNDAELRKMAQESGWEYIRNSSTIYWVCKPCHSGGKPHDYKCGHCDREFYLRTSLYLYNFSLA